MKKVQALLFGSILSLFAGILAIPSYSYAESVKVLTYNVWDVTIPLGYGYTNIELSSKENKLRIPLICEVLKYGDWDIVFLQEIWNWYDRQTMKNCGYKHVVDLDQHRWLGLPDSGLMILSKHPIVEKHRIAFPENGLAKYKFKDGEYLSNKSGIFAKIAVAGAGEIWFANTHLVSSYQHESYSKQRRDQFGLFTGYALFLANGAPLIVGGDFNFSPPGGNTYEKLFDDVPEFLPGFKRLITGDTCSSCPPSVNPWNDDLGAGLVDYLYASRHFTPSRGGLTLFDGPQYYYQSPKLGLRPLSDHFGWETEFSIFPQAE